MKIKNILLAIWTGICTLSSAVFYVLMKQKKQEEAAAEIEVEKLKDDLAAEKNKTAAAEAKAEQIETVQEKYVEGLKQIEKVENDLNNNAIDTINYNNQLLESLRAKGRARNSNTNSL